MKGVLLGNASQTEPTPWPAQNIADFQHFKLPMADLSSLVWTDVASPLPAGPTFLRGFLYIDSADDIADTFLDAIDSGFVKGVAYINGFNLGRYWNIGDSHALVVQSDSCD